MLYECGNCCNCVICYHMRTCSCAKKLARTYSYGGGCGVDISKLSPRGAKVNNAAKETTGSVQFCSVFVCFFL